LESSEEDGSDGDGMGAHDSSTSVGSKPSQTRGYIEAKSKRQKLKAKKKRQKERKKAVRGGEAGMREDERSTEEEDSPPPFTFSLSYNHMHSIPNWAEGLQSK
jgi:hypothetical protein